MLKLPADGHLGCYPVLLLICDNATVNSCVYLSQAPGPRVSVKLLGFHEAYRAISPRKPLSVWMK